MILYLQSKHTQSIYIFEPIMCIFSNDYAWWSSTRNEEFRCMEDIHIGNQIKSVLESRGISVTEFAKRINKSRENIYSIFTRKTIDTGLLQSISRVLEYDFFMHLSTTHYKLSEEIRLLREENKLLKDYNKLLKKVKKWV